MKKTGLILLLLLWMVSFAYASDAQRQISSGEKTTSTIIKATAGKLFGINMVAGSAGGWVKIYDSSDATTTGDTLLVELKEATQYDSKHIQWQEGLNAYEGIYLETDGTAATTVYYY